MCVLNSPKGYVTFSVLSATEQIALMLNGERRTVVDIVHGPDTILID